MDWMTEHSETVRWIVSSVFVPMVAWVLSAIRNQWTRTEKAFRERLEAAEEDYRRDLAYVERQNADLRSRISELESQLRDTQARLERCEAMWRTPPGFQI